MLRIALTIAALMATSALLSYRSDGAEPAKSGDSASAVQDHGWPRLFKANGYEVMVHQPQIDEWKDFKKIFFRAAIVVGPEGKVEAREYGILRVSAATRVDMETRLVLLQDRKLEELTFPATKPEYAEKLKMTVLAAAPPERPMTISLDRILAGVERSKTQVREAKVNLDPPLIFHSKNPAIMVMFAGKPRMQKVPDTALLYAVNTNWDVLLDGKTSTYYLLNGDHWLMTSDVLKGEWAPAQSLPAEISKLPRDDNFQDVIANIPGKKATAVPKVFVTTSPAELIITDGEPQVELIPNTQLALVKNTDSDLFTHVAEGSYYLLAAGRWFKAKTLDGPWTAATTALPRDFLDIPEDSEAGDVRVSVPGSPEAEAAVIQASIPVQATVNRADVTVNVTYQGQPRFAPIESTPIQYAVNSPQTVLMVEGKYYCCFDGIWFTATHTEGPWIVCDSVPQVIYTIPATHPTYNVTYVYVTNSTPSTVVVSSTAGYTGQYVAAGTVLFGAGVILGAALADDDDYWHCHYHAAHFSYGCGAVYHPHHGGFYAAGYRAYGPYGGAGGWAAYNPATGAYSRGAYRYGPAGSAGARAAYNPWTGAGGAQARVNTPYGSWGRSVVTDGDDWVRGGHRSNSQGSVAAIQGSGGGGAVKWENKYGNGATVAKDKDGDVYVGKDGDVYKRDESGEWNKRQNGEWTKPPNAPTTPRPSANSGQAKPGTTAASGGRPTPGPGPTATPTAKTPFTTSRDMPQQYKDLDREARARDRGATNAQRSQQRAAPAARSSGSSRGGRGR